MRDRPRSENAARLVSHGQVMAGLLLVLAIIAGGIALGLRGFLEVVAAAVITFYLLFIGIKLRVSWASAKSRVPRYRHPSASDQDLPRYTVLVPVYREENVMAPLVKALSSIHYPPNKLEVIILLEPDDAETLAALNGIKLPDNFRPLIVPASGPRTKPKACNVGYQHSSGEMLVIFDAEDRPDPDQLLRAVGAFRALSYRNPDVGCVQAQLAFWNPRESWISSFYWAEYVVHFQTVLVGLSRLGLIPPLGGTSNHFRMEALYDVARANGAWQFEDSSGSRNFYGPWDPYNVTEDADLAFRLALAGYSIGMLDSKTYEEAPDTARKARNQRGRWLQGYMQTGLVHTRHPLWSLRRVGPLRYLAFIMFILGTPVSLILNPLVWGVTILYIGSRLAGDSASAVFIDKLFPAPVYYAGLLVAVVGNLVLFFQKLATPLRQQQETQAHSQRPGRHSLSDYVGLQEYGLTVRLLLTPMWWAFTSVSAYRALRKLLIPSQRSHWDKTPHGHALETEAKLERSSATSGTGSAWDTAGPRRETFAANAMAMPPYRASGPRVAPTAVRPGSTRSSQFGSGVGGQALPGGPGAAPQRRHIEDSPVIAPLSAGAARVVRPDWSDQFSERVGENTRSLHSPAPTAAAETYGTQTLWPQTVEVVSMRDEDRSWFG